MSSFPFDIDIMVEIFRQHDVARAGIFGSFARGEATDQSDIDFLVEFSKKKSLLQLVAFERELSHALGRKVDVQTKAAISPYLRDRILQDLRIVYES